MLRLSKLADYATVLLVQLGQQDSLVTATALAGATGVPEPTVAKLLKGLAADGLVASHRGARGGYRLARAFRNFDCRSHYLGRRADCVDRLRRGAGLRGEIALRPLIRSMGHGEQGHPLHTRIHQS